MKVLTTFRTQWRRFSCGFVLAAGWLPASAQLVPGYPDSVQAYDTREVALLPKFCLHTQSFRISIPGGSDPVEIERWRGVLGETNYEHLHHYCWGLMKTNRAVLLVRNPEYRVSYLNDANKEFDYVIERMPPDYILLPEIYVKKGENLVRLGRGPAAMFQFERAAELKPDYWPSYAQMSDYYKGLGDSEKARQVLARGLEATADAPALKRRLAELGQKGDSKKQASRTQ